jgi:hypothetical protein
VANTVIQDPVNADLLYCGLDNGTYVSFDKGTSWNLFNAMLNVSSYTMMVHPRDNELIVGTHGRSAFVADVKPLQALKDGGQHRVVIAFEPTPIQYDKKWGENEYMWSKPDIPELSIQYYVGSSGDQFLVECYDEKNLLVRKLTCAGDAGFHTLDWDVRIYDNKEPPKAKKKRAVPFVENLVYAPPGNYKFKFTRGTDFSEITVAVEE